MNYNAEELRTNLFLEKKKLVLFSHISSSPVV